MQPTWSKSTELHDILTKIMDLTAILRKCIDIFSTGLLSLILLIMASHYWIGASIREKIGFGGGRGKFNSPPSRAHPCMKACLEIRNYLYTAWSKKKRTVDLMPIIFVRFSIGLILCKGEPFMTYHFKNCVDI